MGTAGRSVLVGLDGRLGRITLNRPEALNALSHGMILDVAAALERFAADDTVRTVLIDGTGGRGLCAGGDVRAMYDAARAGDAWPQRMLADEYRLDAAIHRFAKPIVALMDGVVMGGGVGLGAHASHPVVTERSVVAMPEVGIGYAPDVGATWLLSRGSGELGTHVALTGARLGAADAIAVGLAGHHVPAAHLGGLVTALTHEPADEAIAAFAAPAAPGLLADQRGWIDAAYDGDDVEEVVRRLAGARGRDGADAARAMSRMSPTSLKVALRELRTARRLADLEQCLEMEHRVSTTFLGTHDFVEGVRAAVVDKDRAPRWEPATLAEVDDATVERFFADRPGSLRLHRSA